MDISRTIALIILAVSLATLQQAPAAVADATASPGEVAAASGLQELLPAPAESWEGVAGRLASVLTDESAGEREAPLFAPGSRAWAFGDQPASPAGLRGRFEGMQVVLLQTYLLKQATPATDLGRALRSEDSPVAPEVARLLVPRRGEERAADNIAVQWLRRALSAGIDDRVAVLVLWDGSEEATAAGRLWFVLVKGSQLADGRWRIETLRFGSAADAIRHGG